MKIIGKKGQVTIFIIVAIVVVAAVLGYFALQSSFVESIPEDIRPVYDYYLSCVEDAVDRGAGILGSRGGYINVPDFEAGSLFMPQSSQLSFMGLAVPYWMYVSGNNILREQVPSKAEMEEQLGNYVAKEIMKCDFSDFEKSGYDVYLEGATASVSINDLSIDVAVDEDLFIYYRDSSVKVATHEVEVSSKLGKFYGMAMEVYNFEKSEVFLEEYALDVMRLYAPVDGVDLTCDTKVFRDEEIREDIVEGLVSNVAFLKLRGDYYDLGEGDKGYFVVDGFDVDENVNFVYSSDWPTRIEIYGDKVVAPVGIQEGLGILGFCYVPYHLIYDINFPVLIQFYDDKELFQFPVVVVISKNQARQALNVAGFSSIESEMCQYKNQKVSVYTYDLNLNPVESRIQFKCLDEVCSIGETSLVGNDALLEDYFPQCLNGFVLATADGYADSVYKISTNEDSVANIIMKKKYEIGLDLGGGVDSALINFDGLSYSATVMYPETGSIELVEDYYNVSVYVYENSSLKFEEINKRECVDVADSGLTGFLGGTHEECYDIVIPGFDISNAVVGGGTSTEYVLENDLSEAFELNINVPLFDAPTSLEELQMNYELVDAEKIYLEFE
ncbi:hypothetical protein KAJ38_01050 [Candidatus Pacearchaeota archaeon]|nr:hypothetical protein [Candidatus Pacearchaeota archaeon]